MVIKTNKEKRTVVAIIPNVRKQMLTTLRKINPILVYMDEVRNIVDALPNVVTKRAKCSSTDMWNEDIGIDIARARAIHAHAQLRVKTLIKVITMIDNRIFRGLSLKYHHAMATVEDYEDLLDGMLEQ